MMTPRVWKGHTSIIDEIAEVGVKPGVVVVSVGGDGLLCGLLEGLQPIVIIACGGAGVSLRLLDEWKKKVAD